MRFVPRSWHNETWICSLRGHCAPARHASTLRPGIDDRLGVDTGSGLRLSRCLRCDVWVEHRAPNGHDVRYEFLPALADIDKPRRGKQLQDAILLRLIALDRALHAVLFGLLAIALFVLDNRLAGLQDGARSVVRQLTDAVGETNQNASRGWLVRQLTKVSSLKGETLRVLLLTAIVYAVVEGVEAVGLWRERRWAEYLTVIATAGFLPFELNELRHRVTPFRIGALVINVALLVWLVINKRLFGVRGGAAAFHEELDWESIVAAPSTS